MHPVLFKLGSMAIYTYGLVMSVGIIAGICLAMYLGRKRGYDGVFVSDAGVWTVISGLLGARLAYVLQNWSTYSSEPLRMLDFRSGGISIQGAIVLGFAATAFCFWRKKISAWNGLDVYSAPVLLGMAIGRIGCVFQACCWGKVSEGLPWGIVYPLSAGLGSAPRHPSQIYEMLMDLALIPLVIWLYNRASFAGQAFWCTIAGYGVVRFVSEIFREGDYAGVMTLAQWFALLFVLVGVLGTFGKLGKPPVQRLELPTESEK